MLSDLWSASGLTRWQSGFRGRRSWSTVRRHLLSAAVAFRWSGIPLDAELYVPEMFNSDSSAPITERRNARIREILDVADANGTYVVIGEVKRIQPAPHGNSLFLKHVPDIGFELSDNRYGWLNRLFPTEIALTGAEDGLHLITAMVVAETPRRARMITLLSLLIATQEWLPVRNAFERATLAKLVRDGRVFDVASALATTTPVKATGPLERA